MYQLQRGVGDIENPLDPIIQKAKENTQFVVLVGLAILLGVGTLFRRSGRR